MAGGKPMRFSFRAWEARFLLTGCRARGRKEILNCFRQRRERDGTVFGTQRDSKQSAGFRVRFRYFSATRHNEHSTWQTLEDLVQESSHAAVFVQTGRQIAVGGFKFACQPRYVGTQLFVGAL